MSGSGQLLPSKAPTTSLGRHGGGEDPSQCCLRSLCAFPPSSPLQEPQP
jgi:hypothetical protein